MNTDSRSTESLPELVLTRRALGTLRIDSFPVQQEASRSEHLHRPSRHLATRALVGDNHPRQHEYSVPLRALDASKSDAYLGLPALIALCSALREKILRGGLIAVGGLNLGDGIDPVYNTVSVAKLTVEKGTNTVIGPRLHPQAAQRALRRDGHIQCPAGGRSCPAAATVQQPCSKPGQQSEISGEVTSK